MSWDNASGEERQPASTDKYWANLTESEKAAAVLLGYNGTIWDNESGSEPQPVSAIKHWDELTSCGEAETEFCPLCHSCVLEIYIYNVCIVLFRAEVYSTTVTRCSFTFYMSNILFGIGSC